MRPPSLWRGLIEKVYQNMPTYVYGCLNKEHPRVELTHGMNDNPVVKCDVCGAVMHRVPQPARFYMNPEGILLDWMDENYKRFRAGKKPINPYKANRPEGLPGRDSDTRKRKV